MSTDNPNASTQQTGQETGHVDHNVAEELANQVNNSQNGNGNGNGSANGNGSGSAESNASGSQAGNESRGSFDMWEDLRNETEQDKQRRNNPGSASAEDHFNSYAAENDVTEDELSGDKITLKEANAIVSLNMAMLDFGTSLICCGIRDDFSLKAQLKYRIHPWRKKAIQIPWVRLVMLPGRKRRPGWALAGAILAGTVPTLGLAFIDNWHEAKARKDPNYQQRTTGEEKNNSGRTNYRYTDPRAKEHPGYEKDDSEYVPFEEIKDDQNPDDDSNNGDRKKKPGRHAKTCPRHEDPENGECNCK